METITAGKSIIGPLQKDWEVSFGHFQERIKSIPSVQSGATSLEQAKKWLETAAKIYPPNAIERLIQQSSGFGAKDIRTLVAHERKEYHPQDSANELYKRKGLENIAAPRGPDIERERILTNIARSILISRHNLERNAHIEQTMSITDSSRRAPWLVGKPGMVATKGNDAFIYDIQFTNKINHVDQGDLIRLHYYDLVANNIGQQPKHLIMAKIHIDPEFANSLVAMAQTSKDSEKMLFKMAADFSSLSEDKIKLQIHHIERQPELYREIISTGEKHWSNLLTGGVPSEKELPRLPLNNEREKAYVDTAKVFLAASQTAKAAESARIEAFDKFVNSMSGFDITKNFTPPYSGALLRTYDHFDAQSAATYLEKNLGIGAEHVRNKKLNVDLLEAAYVRMGGDVSQFYEFKTPSKKGIENTAEQIGFDLSGFYTREMRAFVNPKTRGPIYEAIQGIRETADHSISRINDTAAQSPKINHPDLLPSELTHPSSQVSMKA